MKFEETISQIRTDCYLAVLERYRKNYPDAHFEIITRAKVNHILSPSNDLLWTAKDEKWSFERYTKAFLSEMSGRRQQEEIKRLNEIAKNKIVFLVCYEKDETKCHRSLVKKLMEGTIQPENSIKNIMEELE